MEITIKINISDDLIKKYKNQQDEKTKLEILDEAEFQLNDGQWQDQVITSIENS